MKFYQLDTVFRFGKFKDKTVQEVFEATPSYIDFCLRELDHFAITPETLDQLRKLDPTFTFSAAALESVIEEPVEPEGDYDNEPPPGQRNTPEYYEMMKRLHPRIADDDRADYWIDLADDVGCDPEDLRDNLD